MIRSWFVGKSTELLEPIMHVTISSKVGLDVAIDSERNHHRTNCLVSPVIITGVFGCWGYKQLARS